MITAAVMKVLKMCTHVEKNFVANSAYIKLFSILACCSGVMPQRMGGVDHHWCGSSWTRNLHSTIPACHWKSMAGLSFWRFCLLSFFEVDPVKTQFCLVENHPMQFYLKVNMQMCKRPTKKMRIRSKVLL